MFISVAEEILTQAQMTEPFYPEDHVSRSSQGQPRSGTKIERSALAITCPHHWAH
jgi:hypothetical protein